MSRHNKKDKAAVLSEVFGSASGDTYSQTSYSSSDEESHYTTNPESKESELEQCGRKRCKRRSRSNSCRSRSRSHSRSCSRSRSHSRSSKKHNKSCDSSSDHSSGKDKSNGWVIWLVLFIIFIVIIVAIGWNYYDTVGVGAYGENTGVWWLLGVVFFIILVAIVLWALFAGGKKHK